MAKPRLVRPELTEEDVKAVLGTGSYNISELERQSPFSRQQIKRMRDDLVEKGIIPKRKINLPSRANLNLIPVDPPAVKLPAPAPAKPKPSPIIQRLIGFGCLLVAVGFGIGNAIMNYRFGVSFGQDETSRLVLGGLTIAIDGGALLLFAAAGYLREQRFYGLYLWAFLTWLICVALSTGAALGFASSNIGDSLQARASIIQHRRELDTELSRAAAERGKIMEDRDPQAIEQQIQIEQGKVPTKSLASSNNCSNVTVSGPFCVDLNRAKAAKVAAEQRIRLEDRMRTISGEIAALAPVSAKDPVAEQVAQMAFGLVTPEQIRNYLVRCFAIIPGFASVLLAIARVLLR